jgi:pilus assembly protein TadC
LAERETMDILFETITDLLNSLIPAGATLANEFSTLNELIAYLISLGIIYRFFLLPLMKLLRLAK